MTSYRAMSIVGRFLLPLLSGAPRLRGRPAPYRRRRSGSGAVGAKAEGVLAVPPIARPPLGHGHNNVPLAGQQADNLLPVILLIPPALVGDGGSLRTREGRRPDRWRSRSTSTRRGGRWRVVLGPMPAVSKFCSGVSLCAFAVANVSLFS